MKASFVEKSTLVSWWGIWMVPDVVIHSTKSSLEFVDFLQ